jgi:ATP-dependent Clp protease ATP-binding subunit ClpB
MDEIERKIKQLEIEREAIKREKDESESGFPERRYRQLKEEQSRYRAQWEMEKSLLNGIQQNKTEIEI